VALGDVPEFLDVLDTLPKGINYAGYMGHCACAPT
jgi:N-acyl-D-amino-acid deacylase